MLLNSWRWLSSWSHPKFCHNPCLQSVLTKMSRTNTLYSLGVLPAMMGLGHLAPAIGAIETATGSYQFPVSLLGLIATISGLVDGKFQLHLPSTHFVVRLLTSGETNSHRYLQRRPCFEKTAKMDLEGLGVRVVGGRGCLYLAVRVADGDTDLSCLASWSAMGCSMHSLVLQEQWLILD